MPEPRAAPRDAETVVGVYVPLLREMMLGADQKKKYGVPPAEWWLFTSTKVRNPHVPPNAHCVAASDFSYLTDIRAAFEKGDKRRDLYVDAEEFGASAMVQSVRKEGPSGLKSKWCRQITPLTPPQNERYEELEGCVLITGGAGGLGRLLTDYLLHYYPKCSVAIASRSAKASDDPRYKCYACDVCDQDDVRRVCDSINDLVGVIHCAGVMYGGAIDSVYASTASYAIHTQAPSPPRTRPTPSCCSTSSTGARATCMRPRANGSYASSGSRRPFQLPLACAPGSPESSRLTYAHAGLQPDALRRGQLVHGLVRGGLSGEGRS